MYNQPTTFETNLERLTHNFHNILKEIILMDEM